MQIAVLVEAQIEKCFSINMAIARYWCPRDGSLGLDQQGYLTDPSQKYGAHLNPQVRTFDQIAETRCLVLLGEPGIGKSTALKSARPAAQAALKSGDFLLWNDLREFSSEDRLYRTLFESPEWKTWLSGTGDLHLVLDSLDEVRIRISNVTQMLATALEHAPHGRLKMWISCRTADWPHSFESRLNDIWGPKVIQVYELTPLRLMDAKILATEYGVDAEAFSVQVAQRNVGTFAARPVTLKLLLRQFKDAGMLPQSRGAIYERGCMNLVSEPDLERRDNAKVDSRIRPVLSPEGRIRIAARLAAMMLLTNRTTIFTGLKDDALPGEDILPSEIVGGTESDGTNEFNVDEACIEEVLRTGLFTARAAQRLGWAHQTYAEFLAAFYLTAAPLNQLLSLLVHPLDAQGRIVPQLHQLASWLSSRRDDLFKHICNVEPSVLLRSDLSLLEFTSKANIVQGVLDRLMQGAIIADLDSNHDFSGLTHPRLAEQLEPIIADMKNPFEARSTAIDIAASCQTTNLTGTLTKIALDQGETYRIRIEAAHAILKIGDLESKRRLLPLAQGLAGNDPDDELRGGALRALWPDIISIDELLPCLIEPKNKSLIGSYSMFLRTNFLRAARPEHLPAILGYAPRWMDPRDSRLNDLAEAVMNMAAKHLDKPELRALLSHAILARIKRHYAPFEDAPAGTLVQHVDGRRALIRTLINETDLSEYDSNQLFMGSQPLLYREDNSWCIDEARKAPVDRLLIWAKVIDSFSDFALDANFCDALIQLIREIPAVAEKFPWMRPWPLEDSASRHVKANYLKQQRWARQRKAPKPPDIATDLASLERQLERYEKSGTAGSWIRFCFMLTETSSGNDSFWGDITESAGWTSLPGSLQDRTRLAAKRYIEEHAPDTSEWLHTNSYPHIVLCGYHAFRLVLDDAEFLSHISHAKWALWAPILVTFPVNSEDPILPKQVEVATRHNPEAVLQIFSTLVDSELNSDHSLFVDWRFERCWDNRFEAILLGKARQPGLTARSLGALLGLLLKKKNHDAQEFLASILLQETETDERLEKCIALALEHRIGSSWQAIARLLNGKPTVGKAGIIDLAGRMDADKINYVSTLGPAAATDFYLWLNKEFPPTPRSTDGEATFVTPRHRVEEIRNGILHQLVELGTFESVREISRLMTAVPEQAHLAWSLERARTNTLREEWRPALLPDLLDLLQHKQRRLVENEEQLQSVVLESLERLQKELQGESPSAPELWNYEGSGNQRSNFRPKDEEDLSEKVARWLRADIGPTSGLIVNREVQPRRGQRTDIYISALPKNAQGVHVPLTVVIEVKGCWNQELLSALQIQLIEKYLLPNGHRCGIYLIGSFNCDKWAIENRKTISDRQAKDISALGKLLTDQAVAATKANAGLRIAAKVLDIRI